MKDETTPEELILHFERAVRDGGDTLNTSVGLLARMVGKEGHIAMLTKALEAMVHAGREASHALAELGFSTNDLNAAATDAVEVLAMVNGSPQASDAEVSSREGSE